MFITKPNSIFLILSLLFLFFLLPLFFITKTSLEPNLSFYLNFFPTQFTVSDINNYDVSNATIHPNPLHKSNKDDTFFDQTDTFVDISDKGDTFDVIETTTKIKYDVSNATNNPNPVHKTNKDDTFVDNNGDGIIYDATNATKNPNPPHKTKEDGKFVEKGVIFVDKNEDGIKFDVSNATKHPDPLHETKKGDTFVGKEGDGIRYEVPNATNHPKPPHQTKTDDTFGDDNGDGIGTSKVQEVVLSSKPGSGTERSEDERKRKEAEVLRKCNLYEGKWVKDEEGKNYPMYKPGSCPYVDEAYDCQTNGRSDSEYLKWRWKPDECELPRCV